MDVAPLTRTSTANPFTAVSGSAASPGVRQALALIDGAIDTVRTVKREAQSVQRRAPEPFADKVDIKPQTTRDAARDTAATEDTPQADETKKASADFHDLLSGHAETEHATSAPTGAPTGPEHSATGRGALVDIQA